MPLNLKSVANGSVILNPASTVTDKTITIPATDGTMVVQDSSNITSVTNLAYTGTLTGGTGVVNIGSGQVYKDASGNLGIGTASPSARLDVRSTGTPALYVVAPAAGSAGDVATIGILGITNGYRLTRDSVNNVTHSWSNQSTQAMTLDSSGNLLVGTTSSSGRLTINGASATSASNCIVLNNSSGANLFILRNDGALFTGVQAASPYNLIIGSAANAVLNSDGFLYRSTSSLKYKTDVNDAIHGLAELLTLRPVTYKGKSDADGDTVYGGLIAEEVDEAGLTEFVQYSTDGTPDAIHYGNMVSLCIKAIQELKAEFDAYKLSHP